MFVLLQASSQELDLFADKERMNEISFRLEDGPDEDWETTDYGPDEWFMEA